MTTSPGACPSSNPAPGGVPLTLPDDATSAASGQSTTDFYKYISQAYRQRQDDAAAASARQREQDAAAASNSTDASSKPSDTDSDSSTDNKTDSKTTKKKTDDIDASVSSMAMAMMLPQA